MNYTSICDYIINYLIDKNINFSKNDTTKVKIKKYLLKYKRIIAIFLLIVLLYIGNQCNLSYLKFNSNVNYKKENILNGGAGAGAGALGEIAKVTEALTKAGQGQGQGKGESNSKGSGGPTNALDKAKASDTRTAAEKTYDFGKKYANKIKDNADVFYGFLYSIAITILMFLIFVPAVGFIVIGFICYSLLKNRIVSLKSL